MLRAVLFDLDGTLLDTEFQYTHFWDEVGHEYLPDAVDFAKKIKGLTLKQIYEDYFDSSSICACISSRLELFEQAMVYKFIPHSISFIQDLRRHGIKCAVITSSNDAKMACVRRAIPDFDKYFDAVLVSGDFEFSKPHPDCFIKGCNRLGVNFEECIIFEDALAGLEAGYRSSIMTVGVEGTCRQEEMMSYCDVVISSFANKDYKWAEDLLNKRRYISDKERVVLEYLDSHSIEYSVYRHPKNEYTGTLYLITSHPNQIKPLVTYKLI